MNVSGETLDGQPWPYRGTKGKVMAWSPYKDTIIAYVSRHPGCSKWDVASHCTHSAQRCPSKQYYLVNTALRNGWIAGRQQGRQYRLYVPTADAGRKLAERRERRKVKATATLAQRLSAYKISKLPAQYPGLQAVKTSDGYRLQIGNMTCCTSDYATATAFAAREYAWEQQRIAERAEREAQAARDYQASTALPPGRIIFNSEGGFRVENN